MPTFLHVTDAPTRDGYAHVPDGQAENLGRLTIASVVAINVCSRSERPGALGGYVIKH